MTRLRAEHPANATLAADSGGDFLGFMCRSLDTVREQCLRLETEGPEAILSPELTDSKYRAQIVDGYRKMCANVTKR